MKKPIINLVIVLAVLFAASSIYTSCKKEEKDPCEGVTCKNGGTCSDGNCTCAAGYEGTDCGTVSRDKFLGANGSAANYTDNGSDNCSSANVDVVVSASNVAVNKILISNFGAYGCNSVWPTIEAAVSGSNITIAEQTFCSPGDPFTVKGTGSVSGNILTINYYGNTPPSDTASTGLTYNCSVTFTKQ